MDRAPIRREKLRKSIKSDKVDAYLISSEFNVSYLTGFSGDVYTATVRARRSISHTRFTPAKK